jgi:DnaJ-like protein
LKTYYEVLGVAVSATSDEIKRAFRREISRYHPDKVQHLGHEFQEMAAAIAADLTEAYRVLMDTALRAQYDAALHDTPGTAAVDERAASGSPPPEPAPRPAPEPPPPPFPPTVPRGTVPLGIDVVRKATLARLKSAIDDVLGAQAAPVPGFDAAFLARPPKPLFRKAEPTIRLLVKFVQLVDADAVARIWPDAVAAGGPGVIVSVLLLGYGLAPARDLSRAITTQREITGKHGPVLIPVDVRDWDALFPADTPPALRLLVERLRSNQS